MDFLDVIFNLETGRFLPFRKPNTYQPLYINAKFNQPSTILRDLPNMINKRLSDLPCNEEEYGKPKPLCKTVLHESGYKTTITYTKTPTANNRNRTPNIIWFNPAYCRNVKTNIGKRFIKLVKKLQEIINYIKYSMEIY